MKSAVLALLGLVLVVGVVHADDEAKKPHERTVVVPVRDNCTVQVGDVVRFPAHGIAGSQFNITVDGAGKLTGTTQIIERAGKQNFIGTTKLDYEVKATRKGTATVTITIKPPNGEQKEFVFKIEVE